MTFRRLLRRSLCFYWQTNLGVVLAVTATAAVLAGALFVGDSVHYSLTAMTSARLGNIQFALSGYDRFFSSQLADDLADELKTQVVPLLQLNGMLTNTDESQRINAVQVLGVDSRFFELGNSESPFDEISQDIVVLNEYAAARLQVKTGDEIILRIARSSLVPRDISIASDSKQSAAFRLKIQTILNASQFGNFTLQANQLPAANAFMPLKRLQQNLDHHNQANVLLVPNDNDRKITIETANAAISKCWKLSDTGLEFRQLYRQNQLQLQSNRIFIDDSLADAALTANKDAIGIFSYFANKIKVKDNTTPYSIVTALSPSDMDNSLISSQMGDGQIIINNWLAEDLDAKVGDKLSLTYYTVTRTSQLQEQSTDFMISQIVPLDGIANDPDLMPDFPGLSDVDNCSEWTPGIPIDLKKIRDKDEQYWDNYRGNPKAFITLAAAQKLWSNRYGKLTAVRFNLDSNTPQELTSKILKTVSPASIGLFFQPVRDRNIKAANRSTDFGQLFLGFSMFLIAACLILTALTFIFGVENRTEQFGILLALGLPQRIIKWLIFTEGLILSVIGSVMGCFLGLAYTKAMIFALSTVWSKAVIGSPIIFHAKPETFPMAAISCIIISTFAIWLTARKFLTRSPKTLFAGNVPAQFSSVVKISTRKPGIIFAAISATTAIIILFTMPSTENSASAFFGAAALLLFSVLALSYTLVKLPLGKGIHALKSFSQLAIRNTARRAWRSLAVIALLASATFFTISIGANRHNPLANTDNRNSGTGGFALYAQSSIGIQKDLNTFGARREIGLDKPEFDNVTFVQFRLHEGDDASCFNLNQAQQPRILAVNPQQLIDKHPFKFIDVIENLDLNSGWDMLNIDLGPNIVPAIGDQATVRWALGKSVGDYIEYINKNGIHFQVCIVAKLQSSLLQGSLVIAEDQFLKHFPSEGGFQTFLIDVPGDKPDIVQKQISKSLTDYGIEIMPAAEKLAQFSAVENTYLSIFQVLAGLGLILGTIGLGLVVLRNVLERKNELAMLCAVGFSKKTIQMMLFYEHLYIMFWGVICGLITGLVAVLPAIKSDPGRFPALSLAVTIATIILTGTLCIFLSTKIALSGQLIKALRYE